MKSPPKFGQEQLYQDLVNHVSSVVGTFKDQHQYTPNHAKEFKLVDWFRYERLFCFDDLGTDFYSEVFDATMLPATV